MKSLLFVLCLMIALVDFISEGKHVFSFIDSNPDSSSYGIINIRCVSSQMEVHGILDIPQQDDHYEFNATSLQAANIYVPYNAIPSGSGIQLTTVIIETDNDDVDLLVYAHSYTPEQESFMVLPSEALGRLYYVMSFRSTQGNGVFSISPVNSGTQVSVYFNQDFSFEGNIYNVNNPYQVTLNTRTLHFQTSFDPTGTWIESSKKVQVVSGNDCAGIPSSVTNCNHISEALPPVEVWGSSYVVAPFHDRNSGYLVRILASEDNTEVEIQLLDRTETVSLDAGTLKEKLVAIPAVLTITASHPILVVQFMRNSIGTDLNNGSPAMVIVPGIEHSISTYLPFTSLSGFTSNHVTVWLSSFDLDGLRIDEDPALPWIFVGPAFGGVVAQTSVSPGEHYLSHVNPSVRLCGVAYGYGSYVSYVHPIYFNPMTASTDEGTKPPDIENCPDSIVVECPTDSNVASVTWIPPRASSSSPLLPITSNSQSGDSFGIGTTSVIYQFSDVFGNEAVCTFQVEVQDVSPPEIFNCPSNFNVTVCDTSPGINWLEPYAIDNSMEDYHVMQSSQTTTNGKEIRYSFWDKSGNEATCIFIIHMSYPSNCKVAATRSSLKTAAISLGLGIFCLLMLLCSLFIWDSLNKYVKEKSLSHKSRGNESRNYYKNNAAESSDKAESDRDSLYLKPTTSTASD